MTNKRFHLEKLVCIVLLLACLAGLMVGCANRPAEPEIVMRMCYLIREEDRTFDANEDIIIDFYCGTSIPKNDRQYSQFKQLKVYAREYSGYSSFSEAETSFIADCESNDFYNISCGIRRSVF